MVITQLQTNLICSQEETFRTIQKNLLDINANLRIATSEYCTMVLIDNFRYRTEKEINNFRRSRAQVKIREQNINQKVQETILQLEDLPKKAREQFPYPLGILFKNPTVSQLIKKTFQLIKTNSSSVGEMYENIIGFYADDTTAMIAKIEAWKRDQMHPAIEESLALEVMSVKKRKKKIRSSNL